MHNVDLMQVRVSELRAEGRRAGAGTGIARQPSRLASSLRRLTRRQR